MNTARLVGLAVVVAAVAGIVFIAMQKAPAPAYAGVTTYEECVAGGYPVVESTPSPQCSTPDGRTFVASNHNLETLSGGTATPSPSPAPAQAAGGCVVGGCSGQICGDAKDGPAVSTCEYKAEYGC